MQKKKKNVKSQKINNTNDSIEIGGRAEKHTISIGGTGFSERQENIVKKYKLKGVEFGNYVSQKDRIMFIKILENDLPVLSRVLGTKNLGMSGTIGIAFGARGGSPALAHFEPATMMINLTKRSGAGCLCHEYGHALDYFFGSFVELDKKQKTRSLTGGKTTSPGSSFQKDTPMRVEMQNLLNKVIFNKDGGFSRYYKYLQSTKSRYLRGRTEIFARLFEKHVSMVLSSRKLNPTCLLVHKSYRHPIYLNDNDYKKVKPLISSFLRNIAKKLNS